MWMLPAVYLMSYYNKKVGTSTNSLRITRTQGRSVQGGNHGHGQVLQARDERSTPKHEGVSSSEESALGQISGCLSKGLSH